jgi:hypothetical protein
VILLVVAGAWLLHNAVYLLAASAGPGLLGSVVGLIVAALLLAAGIWNVQAGLARNRRPVERITATKTFTEDRD